MALDKMAALEARVRELVGLVQELKCENAGLKNDVRAARERLVKQNDVTHRWVTERTDIKSRIEKVLGDLDSLEVLEESKEVALD